MGQRERGEAMPEPQSRAGLATGDPRQRSFADAVSRRDHCTEATETGRPHFGGEGAGLGAGVSDDQMLKKFLENEDPLPRIVLVTDLLPSISAEVLRVGLSQFGSVRRVMIRKDLLNPRANEVTWAGASALVEMGSTKEAGAVVDECAHNLVICGAGPRPVRAVPATLAMLDDADWPEVHLYHLHQRSKAKDARPPLYLMEATAPGSAARGSAQAEQAGGVPPAVQQRIDLIGLEKWQEAKAVSLSQDADLRMFEARVSALQKEEHRRHQRTLDIQEWKFTQLDRAAPNVSAKRRHMMRNR